MNRKSDALPTAPPHHTRTTNITNIDVGGISTFVAAWRFQ